MQISVLNDFDQMITSIQDNVNDNVNLVYGILTKEELFDTLMANHKHMLVGNPEEGDTPELIFEKYIMMLDDMKTYSESITSLKSSIYYVENFINENGNAEVVNLSDLDIEDIAEEAFVFIAEKIGSIAEKRNNR